MSNTQTARILIVEDEPLILYSIGEELRDAGFDVLEALNADEALVLLAQNPDVQILFTDVDMPGSMNGLALSAVVRDRWPPVRIVMTSGKVDSRHPSLADDSVFVPKPYNPNRLIDTLRAIIS